MASYNILIASVYVLYNIFKEKRPDFRYNKDLTLVNLWEISLIEFLLYIWNADLIVVMVTQNISVSCGLFG